MGERPAIEFRGIPAGFSTRRGAIQEQTLDAPPGFPSRAQKWGSIIKADGDSIQTGKILHGFDNIKTSSQQQFPNRCTLLMTMFEH